MRVVVSGRGAEDPTGAVRLTVVQSLEHEGHDVLGIDPVRHATTPSDRTGVLGAALVGFEADLLVVVPTPGDLDLAAVRALTIDLDVLSIGMHTGTTLGAAVTRLDDIPEHVVHFDIVTAPDDAARARFAPWGRHGLVELRPAVVPDVLDREHPTAVAATQVVCLGDADHHNADLVRSLVAVGVDVGIVGSGWDAVADLRLRWAGRCSVTERSARLAAAELAVELPPTLRQRSDAGCSLDDCLLGQLALDAAALGTPVVAIDRPGLDRHLEPGDEVIVVGDASELPDLVRLVLATPIDLAAVGLAGQTRLRVEHRWDQRWSALASWFGLDTVAAPRPATSGVSVVIPLDASTSPHDLNVTVESVRAADPSVELVLCGVTGADHLAAIGELPNTVVVDAADAGPGLAIRIGVARSTRELVATVRAGQTWHVDRLPAGLAVLRSTEGDIVHSTVIESMAGPYDSWNAVRSRFGGSGFSPETVLARRRVLLEEGLVGVLSGEADVIVAAVAACSVLRIDAVLVTGAVAAPLPVPDGCVTDLFRAIERLNDRDRGAAAAFVGLAVDVVEESPDLAVSLVALALDHHDDDHDELLAIVRGEIGPSRAQLRQLAAALGDELNAVVPGASDHVWDHTVARVSVARLVVDPSLLDESTLDEVVAAFGRRFGVGEPVELVVRSADGRDAVLSRLAGVFDRGGIDPRAVADITVASTVSSPLGSDLFIGRGVTPERAIDLAEAWMAEQRAVLDSRTMTAGRGS